MERSFHVISGYRLPLPVPLEQEAVAAAGREVGTILLAPRRLEQVYIENQSSCAIVPEAPMRLIASQDRRHGHVRLCRPRRRARERRRSRCRGRPGVLKAFELYGDDRGAFKASFDARMARRGRCRRPYWPVMIQKSPLRTAPEAEVKSLLSRRSRGSLPVSQGLWSAWHAPGAPSASHAGANERLLEASTRVWLL